LEEIYIALFFIFLVYKIAICASLGMDISLFYLVDFLVCSLLLKAQSPVPYYSKRTKQIAIAATVVSRCCMSVEDWAGQRSIVSTS
jgi:hypothetical protein